MRFVKSSLNKTILDRLGNRFLLTAFTGLPMDVPLSSLKRTEGKRVEVKYLNDIFKTQKSNRNNLLVSPQQIHKEVMDKNQES